MPVTQTLAEKIKLKPLSIPEFLEISPQLAEVLARLHEIHIVYRNINPAHITWDPETRKATLVDFGPAANLSYISPEQTGRTGRSVDSRTDLYSLGVTFYELLTGLPPFVAKDPIEFVHAHLAWRPKPLNEVNSQIPIALSKIILKCLEKEPENRYQTANALATDLREAKNQWDRTGKIIEFPLAYHDVPRKLSVPDKLYGRAEEVNVLQEAFARASQGQLELVLVSGDPGIGKSALVSHFERPVTERCGLFFTGKFDQLQRSVPYSGLSQAFRMLVRKLLTEPDAILAMWRERIQNAVAPNGKVLIEVIPELELIIGAQAPVATLGAIESRNRFNLVFTSFLRAFSKAGFPLVIFLDDLQWIDIASLNLLEQWLGDTENRYLLVIGSYRDTEVGSEHFLARSLVKIREAGIKIHEIHLGPLDEDDVAQLISGVFTETFSSKALNQEESSHVRSLADLVLKKTAGNPFFVKRFLHTLYTENLIRFSPETRTWQWDLNEIERAPFSDNVLEFMVQAINRLPEGTKRLLQAGACIGHHFDMDILEEVMGASRREAMNQLWPALEDGLLVPLRETNQVHFRTDPRDGYLLEDESLDVMKFVHDRIQQAAYFLIPQEQRWKLHLEIGRCLLRKTVDEKLDEGLFDIVDHLCLGEALIVDSEERRRLVELSLAAGRKAKVSAAYQSAFDYLSVAKRNLPERVWETNSNLAFVLHRELAEAAYLTGQHDEAERLIEYGLEHAPSKLAKMELYSLRAVAACVAGDNARGLKAGRQGLSLFGLEWPLEGLAEAIETEAAAVMTNLRGRPINTLAEEPEPRDEGVRACIRLLSVLGPPAYFSDSNVLAFVVARLTNLSLVHGPSEYSAYGYTFYGALHNRRTGDYETGYAFGRLALALARRFKNRGEESRTVEVFSLIVNPWKAPLRTSMPLAKEGYQAGLESGELLYVALNLSAILIIGLPVGVPLSELEKDVEASLDFSKKHGNKTNLELTLPYRQIIHCLTGRTQGSPSNFEDAEFREAHFLEETQNNLTALAFYWINRLQADYLIGNFASARTSAAKAAKALPSVMGMIREAEYVFYAALTTAALYRETPQQTQLVELQAFRNKLATWAKHCPENFRHKEQLVAAEFTKIAGEPWRALTLYRAALEEAKREQFVQDKALAAELLGKFLLSEGDTFAGSVYLRVAREEYRKWGAILKVRLLEEAYPSLLEASNPVILTSSRKLPLDTLGLIKASQAISAEVNPEKLVEQILHIVIEVAGAEGGTLLMNISGELVARGRATSDLTGTTSLVQIPLAECRHLPQKLVRYVMRTKEPLVLGDAGKEGPFVSDPAVQELRLRSLLCVPLKRQSEVVGILYLENNAMAGAFSQERVEVVQILATQAVISLEKSIFLRERERMEQMARFLANAGAALVESLDYSTTLTRVVHLAVPTFADWCLLDIIEESGEVHRVEAVHSDPAHTSLAESLRSFSAVPGGKREHPPTQALFEGHPTLLEDISEKELRAMAFSEEHYQIIKAMRPRSSISVPLISRGRTLGVLTFITAQSGQRYGKADLEMAQELAKRCALAMDNARLYRDAQEAIQNAKKAIEIRDEFLSIASHELKTPLTPLQIQIQIFERRLPKLIENKENATWAQAKLGLLRRQGQRLERLVNELLDITRISGGRLNLELERVDLLDVVRQIVNRFTENGEIARSGSKVTLVAGESAVGIRGIWDKLRIEQVITNLFSNALKYGKGKPIEIALTLENSNAKIRVTDHGIGVESEHFERIFGRFERAVSSSHYGGLGLGLYIVNQIVNAMGGSIQLQSKIGEGSTFAVTLPLTRPNSSVTMEKTGS